MVNLERVTWRSRAVLVAAFIVVVPMATVAQGSATPEQRLNRLERLLDSESLLKLFQTTENLQQEVRALRGEMEVLAHQIGEIRRRQTDLYLDIDKRMQALEAGQVPSPTSGAAGAVRPAGQIAGGTSGQSTQSQSVPASGSTAAAASNPGAVAPTNQSAAASGAARQPARQTGTSTSAASIVSPMNRPSSTPAANVPAGQATTMGGADQSVPVAATDPVAEQKAYKDAFGLLKAGRYEDAATAFQAFLGAYGQGEFADNAQYWLGETYYVTRQFDLALREFQTLVVQHPKSQKLTHAMLKIGYIHDELGQPGEARQALGELIERFPKTTAAGLAKKRLQRLRSQ